MRELCDGDQSGFVGEMNFVCPLIYCAIYREVASKTFAGGVETKSQRPFPRFLVKLSELCPRLVHKQMVVLQKHLDSEVSVTLFFSLAPLFVYLFI